MCRVKIEFNISKFMLIMNFLNRIGCGKIIDMKMMVLKPFLKTILCTRLIIIVIFFLCMMSFAGPVSAGEISARSGHIDLNDWKPDEDGRIPLDGQWAFYWQQLLSPEDFGPAQTLKSADYIDVPGLWNSYPQNTHQWPGDGFATYRLLLDNIPINNRLIYLKIPKCRQLIVCGQMGGLYLKIVSWEKTNRR